MYLLSKISFLISCALKLINFTEFSHIHCFISFDKLTNARTYAHAYTHTHTALAIIIQLLLNKGGAGIMCGDTCKGSRRWNGLLLLVCCFIINHTFYRYETHIKRKWLNHSYALYFFQEHGSTTNHLLREEGQQGGRSHCVPQYCTYYKQQHDKIYIGMINLINWAWCLTFEALLQSSDGLWKFVGDDVRE